LASQIFATFFRYFYFSRQEFFCPVSILIGTPGFSLGAQIFATVFDIFFFLFGKILFLSTENFCFSLWKNLAFLYGKFLTFSGFVARKVSKISNLVPPRSPTWFSSFPTPNSVALVPGPRVHLAVR